MKKKKAVYAHVDHEDGVKRLNRVIGQIEGIRTMLKDQRKLKDVLAQCKAAQSGLKAVEMQLVHAHLQAALESLAKTDKKKERQALAEDIEALYRLG